jgi:hypothetical protein
MHLGNLDNDLWWRLLPVLISFHSVKTTSVEDHFPIMSFGISVSLLTHCQDSTQILSPLLTGRQQRLSLSSRQELPRKCIKKTEKCR